MKKPDGKTNECSSSFVTLGLLAHVDAGKTTLAEALLFTAGKLSRMGRVDHRDAFLDTHEIEKKRGITIFSKQAQLFADGLCVTLLDTPGHADFSPEAERAVQVLDYAVLVISASDGIQGHVLTLWRLLEQYRIPVFLFINKMDLDGADKNLLLEKIKSSLSDSCVDFSVRDEAFYENCATCSEEALEEYLESGRVSDALIQKAVSARRLFPCFFGSALKLRGVEDFLHCLCRFMLPADYPDEFAARVFKIARDEHGERLTYLKVTGGKLKVKTSICVSSSAGGLFGTEESGRRSCEKINQIRIYDGAGYKTADEAPAGCICAVTGPALTRSGDGLGAEKKSIRSRIMPVLTYSLIFPEGCDLNKTFRQLCRLEEEVPEIHVRQNKESGEISVRVMGEVQTEILKTLIKERCGIEAEFGQGRIIYKETINNTVEGTGHFEPLGHYAEVHLLLESAPRGSGMIYDTDCSEDILDRNWQRLILTHLSEKQHRGVLTGAELTDIKITLKSGRAHTKHTEGGDFRQAAWRAVRQGLMQAENILLEPYYSFRLELPAHLAGRAMNDIRRMNGEFDPAEQTADTAVITGRAPAAAMRSYPAQVTSYTRGTGHIYLEFSGYEACHNAQEIIALSGYEALRDTENPSSSIFCSHGGGYTVSWDKVSEHMHLEAVLKNKAAPEEKKESQSRGTAKKSSKAAGAELKEIFERTYGSGTFYRSSAEYDRRNINEKPEKERGAGTSASKQGKKKEFRLKKPEDKYLFVDGYNIIFAWDELKSLAKENIDAAREQLCEIMCNFQGITGINLVLVFDAYRVKENRQRVSRFSNISVVFTKEGESADQYIEKKAAELGRRYDITVATSDRLEQVSVFGHGARRMSAGELYAEVEAACAELEEKYLNKNPKTGNGLFDNSP